MKNPILTEGKTVLMSQTVILFNLKTKKKIAPQDNARAITRETETFKNDNKRIYIVQILVKQKN